MAFPLTAVFDLGAKILDRVLPDKAAAAEAKLKLLELQQTGELAQLSAETDLAKGQIDVNKIEANSPKLFVAGWRPFLGWTCGAIFMVNYIGLPLFAWVSPALGIPAPTRLDMGEVLPVLLGMLGLGSMRTVEKIRGVS
jgi:hypothetical protein